MLVTNIVGVVGNIFSVILFVPGAYAVWKNRKDAHSLKGASIYQQLFIVLNAITWGIYAWLTGAYWAAAPGLVNLPLAVFTAYLIHKGSKPVLNRVSD